LALSLSFRRWHQPRVSGIAFRCSKHVVLRETGKRTVFVDVTAGEGTTPEVPASMYLTEYFIVLVNKKSYAETHSLSIYPCIYMALLSFVRPWPLFQFLDFYSVGLIPWTGDQPVARPLLTHRTTQTQNKCTQTFMP
jgi:hypothetical protein